MNYLQLAMTTPDKNSLVLFDRYATARAEFAGYFAEARRQNSIVTRCTDLEFRFPQGGRLLFGVISTPADINRYVGCEWVNVRADHVASHQLATLAVAKLFKPMYNGDQNGV